MAATIATRAAATQTVRGAGWGSAKYSQYGQVTIAANPAPADTYKMVRLPKGAIILGGRITGGSLDNSSTPLIDIDCGVDMGGTLDTDQLGNFGTWKSAAINGYKPQVSYNMPLGGLLVTAGPQTMTGEYNDVYLTVVASAAGDFATATITLEIEYQLS